MDVRNESSPLLGDIDKDNPHYNGTINKSPQTDNDGDLKCHIRTYKRRWYILFVVMLVVFLQNGLCNTWAVIAVSIKPVFGWTDADISLMMCWYYSMYMVFIVPFSWLMENKGVRLPIIITAGCIFVATILRCISMSPPATTWLNNLACCLIGIAQPVAYSIGPVISAVWFPPDERITTTSLMTAVCFLGYGVCYIYGPQIVSVPEKFNSSSVASTMQYSNLNSIREEIRVMCLICCGICGLTFLAILIYFPNKPPKPPSNSSALPKLPFVQGIKTLFRSASVDFWLVCLVYAISCAIYSTWVSLLTVNFGHFIPQVEIGYLGFIANLMAIIAAVIAGRFADVFAARMKLIIVLFVSLSVLSTYWVVLLAMQYISMSTWQIYTSIIIQGLAVAGPMGLYFEMCVEINYPINEIITIGAVQIVYNIFPLVFLFVFFIPNIGVSWMNWFLYGSLLLCFPLILAFKENYRRLAVDRREYHNMATGD